MYCDDRFVRYHRVNGDTANWLQYAGMMMRVLSRSKPGPIVVVQTTPAFSQWHGPLAEATHQPYGDIVETHTAHVTRTSHKP